MTERDIQGQNSLLCFKCYMGTSQSVMTRRGVNNINHRRLIPQVKGVSTKNRRTVIMYRNLKTYLKTHQ